MVLRRAPDPIRLGVRHARPETGDTRSPLVADRFMLVGAEWPSCGFKVNACLLYACLQYSQPLVT